VRIPPSNRAVQKHSGTTLAALISGVALFAAVAWAHRVVYSSPPNSAPHVTRDLTGSVPAHDGQHIRLYTELGNVIVHTSNLPKLDYRVHLETDVSQKQAQKLLNSFHLSLSQTRDGVSLAAGSRDQWTGRLWATLELTIPQNSSLDVSTGGGNIEASDIAGRVRITTQGGNITTGNIGGAAHLETGGGNIVAKNIGGDLLAETGGGHITVGSVNGSATLRTIGGHIRVASVQGAAHFYTGGGNISLEHSGAVLTAQTEGGQIEVGEATGLVRAKTDGGGIRVVRLFGPTDLQTASGSIYLTQIDNAVKASTSSGGITAWFASPPKAHGGCDLQSEDGDIVVHLPREFPVTIDAQVEQQGDHSVIVDPAFPLKISYGDSSDGARVVRAEGTLNGGGEVLHLRALAGNIQFVLSDTEKQMQIYHDQMSQIQKQMTQLQRQLLMQAFDSAGDSESSAGEEPSNQDSPRH
jgi:hypothetical protein